MARASIPPARAVGSWGGAFALLVTFVFEPFGPPRANDRAMDAPGPPLPPFPGPLGPSGEVESLLRLTLGHVNEVDLRAIAGADYGEGEAEVLELLRVPRREGRWPAIADTGDHAFQLHECCSLVLTATDREIGGAHRWRLLFAAGVIAHLVFGVGCKGETWAKLRIGQLLILSAELGPDAARATRPFLAWMRERVPGHAFLEAHEFDVPLLLLDAATGEGAPVTDARVRALWGAVCAYTDGRDGRMDHALRLDHGLWGMWFGDAGTLSPFVASAVLAMAPADPPPALAELLASMVERREPGF